MNNAKKQPTSPSADPDHDAWFRREVEETIRGLNDGSIEKIDESEHDRRWKEKRSAMLASTGKSE